MHTVRDVQRNATPSPAKHFMPFWCCDNAQGKWPGQHLFYRHSDSSPEPSSCQAREAGVLLRNVYQQRGHRS